MRTSTAIKLIILGLVLLAIGVAIKVVGRYTDPERIRQAVQAGLEGVVEGHVSVASARLDFAGKLIAEGIAITLPGRQEPVFACPRVVVALDMSEILALRTVVREVVLIGPVLNLTYLEESGAWNFEALRARGEPTGEPAAGAAPPDIVLENAAVVVQDARLFGDDAPREYAGLYLTLRPDRAATRKWHVEGRVQDGPLAGTRVSGWFAGGGKPRFAFETSCSGLSADEAFWQQIPFGRRVWNDYRLEGGLALQGAVTSRSEGRVGYSFKVRLTQGGLRTKFFPARLSSVNGLLEITNTSVVIKDVTGVIPAEEFGQEAGEVPATQVRVNGAFQTAGGGGSCTVEATGLPLCRASIEAIPGVGPDLWERLRPAGRTRLTLTLTKPGPGEPMRFAAVAELRGVTLRPGELPLPLEQVSGTVVADSSGVRLRDLRGVIVQPDGGQGGASAAPFVVDGFVDRDRRDSVLSVRVRNLRTDEELVKAVPGVGGQIWETLRPEVNLDAAIVLRDAPDSDRMSYAALIECHGGRLGPQFLSMPLTDAAGTIRAEAGKVLVEHFTATIVTDEQAGGGTQTSSTVELRGTFEPQADRAEFYVTVRDLVLSEELLKAVPRVGERVWEEVQPQGVASLNGKVFYDGRDETPLHYFIDMDLRDVALLPKLLPVPIEAFSGQLLITEQRAISNDFTGITCGGDFNGALIVYYGAETELPSYGARASFNNLELARLVERLAGEETGVSGRLTGTVALGGMVGEPESTSGKGTIALTEGHLWQTPFFVKTLNVLHLGMPGDKKTPARGEMRFALRGDEVTIGAFDLTGGGLNISGYGAVWLDGRLGLTMVAIGAPEQGGGIPIVSPVVGWLLQAVESQLVRLDVSGTIQEPVFKSQVLSTITWPLASLRSVLFSPILGGKLEAPPQD